jgi:uncharacterized protein
MFISPSSELLTNDELTKLDSFLKKHKKAMSITEIHGFLCAIMSAPGMIMPSQWQPLLFNEEPEFSSLEQAQEIIGWIMQLNNYSSNQLRGNKPLNLLMWQDGNLITYNDCSEELLAQWCRGYLKGVQLDSVWNADKYAVSNLLPIAVLANQFDLKGDKDSEGNIIIDDKKYKQHYKENLHDYIMEYYSYWLDYRRKNLSSKNKPMSSERDAEKVGRNETCPCGSGKKYKKCCARIHMTLH